MKLRHRANIEPTMGQRIVFAGEVPILTCHFLQVTLSPSTTIIIIVLVADQITVVNPT